MEKFEIRGNDLFNQDFLRACDFIYTSDKICIPVKSKLEIADLINFIFKKSEEITIHHQEILVKLCEKDEMGNPIKTIEKNGSNTYKIKPENQEELDTSFKKKLETIYIQGEINKQVMLAASDILSAKHVRALSMFFKSHQLDKDATSSDCAEKK